MSRQARGAAADDCGSLESQSPDGEAETAGLDDLW
jgi:hypothetical protein